MTFHIDIYIVELVLIIACALVINLIVKKLEPW